MGWGPGVIGVARVGADLASPGGLALRTGTPVISNHLENEERFRTPELLQQHGISLAMNVICKATQAVWGLRDRQPSVTRRAMILFWLDVAFWPKLPFFAIAAIPSATR